MDNRGKTEVFRVSGLWYIRLLALLFFSCVCTGCISYQTSTTTTVSDKLVKDTRKLELKSKTMSAGKLRLQFAQTGQQEIKRTYSHDRHVEYKVESGTIKMIEDTGGSPALIIVIWFAIVNDIIGLVGTGLTQVPAGAFKAMTSPPSGTSNLTLKPSSSTFSGKSIILRFGPRLVASANCDSKGWVTFDISEIAQKLLAQGVTSADVRASIEGSKLSTTFTLSRLSLQLLK